MNSTAPDVDPAVPASQAFASRFWFGAVAVCWLCLAVSGLWMLLAYENQPGTPATAPSKWPLRTSLERATDRPTLVMLVHPHCTCSRASLGELAEVLARSTPHPKTYVVFLKPDGFSDKWEETDLWRTASTLPDTTLVRDDGGVEAERFGAATSGQTFLYDKAGTLIFSGGITGARAHPGDNAGRQALIDELAHGSALQSQTNVFGCPLFATTN